jgi:thiamine-phosphate pyrophosphorylase
MSFSFPKIYPILDASTLPRSGRLEFLGQLGESLAKAGVTLLEYRNKRGNDKEIVDEAKALRASMQKDIKLILDDRADLVDAVNFDGVHVDAGDLSAKEARERLGPGRIIGTFGGSETLVPGILEEPADYFSVGPVYHTTTKETAKVPIGTLGVTRVRAEAGPGPVLVAAGGITLENAAAVLAAGASIVAVSAAIFRARDPAAEFRRWQQRLA